MKSWKKRVLAGTVAGLMLVGTSAFAASYEGDLTITPGANADAEVTVGFTTDLASTDQVTILVYKLGEEGAATQITDANIAFIDQFEKGDNSSVNFYIRSGEGFGPGTYKVLMGGTGVAKAAEGTFTISDGGSGGVVNEVAGTITSNVKISTITTGIEDIDNSAVYTIALVNASMDDSDEAIIDNKFVKVRDGAFTLDGLNLSDGEHIIRITRPGFLSRYIGVTVKDGVATLPADFNVIGGDTDADGEVGSSDAEKVFAPSAHLTVMMSRRRKIFWKVEHTQ